MTNIIPEVGLLLILAVGLRLGVVPLHLPYGEEPRLRRGLGTIVRLSTAASSLVVLARLPMQAIPDRWYAFMLAFAALAAVYGGAMWATAKNELDGRPFLVIAVAGMAFACVIQGNPIASISWGVGLILYGGLIFLASIHYLPVTIIAGLGLTRVFRLAFYPLGEWLGGLITSQFSVVNVFFILAHALIMLGLFASYAASCWRAEGIEGWVKIVYPAGLGGLVVIGWVIALFGQAGRTGDGVWWAAVAAVVLAGGGWWLIIPHRGSAGSRRRGWMVSIVARPVGHWVGVFFGLNWLYRSLYFLYRLIAAVG